MCGCLSRAPCWGIQPITQACAPTGIRTSNPLVCRLALNPLSHTSQGCTHFFKKILFIYFERGEGREGEKHQCVAASCVPPTGDLACNPDMCPNRESDWRLGFTGQHLTTEPHQPRQVFNLNEDQLANFFFHTFGVISKSHCQTQGHLDFLVIVWNFTILHLQLGL